MPEKDIQLTDKQINDIAEKAAEVALNKVYTEVGRNVLKKLAWLTGVAILGLAMWLAGSGHLPKA